MRTCTVCANNLSCDFFDDFIDPGLLSQLRAPFDLHNTFNSACVIVALCSFDFKATQRKPFFTVPCLMLSNFAPKPRCLLAPMATLALRVHEHLGVGPWVPPGFHRCIGYPTHIPSIPATLARKMPRILDDTNAGSDHADFDVPLLFRYHVDERHRPKMCLSTRW